MDYDFDRQDKAKKVRRIVIMILTWIISIGIMITAGYFTVKYSVERTNMVGDSMEATLKNNDTIIINKLSYMNDGPERFDVIVYKATESEHEFYNIKRVIGLPGETVQIMGGKVYIDGALLEEPIYVEDMQIAGLAENKLKLDEDEYFVLGDNRNSSEDSRFSNVGNVIRSSIVGRAWLRTNEFGIISKMNLIQEEEEEEEPEGNEIT